MTSNLRRLYSSTVEISRSRLAFAHPNPRFLISSGQHHQQQDHTKPETAEEETLPYRPTAENIPDETSKAEDADRDDGVHVNKKTVEIGGPKGPEPTRYGDWERGGRCSDF